MHSRPAGPVMRGMDWALLVALGVIWGSSFFFARVAVQEVPPLLMVFLRVGIAAVALLLYLAFAGISLRPLRERPAEFALLAVFNNVIPFTLIFFGQTALGAGLGAVLNATTPFFTLVIAGIATTDERLSARKLAGIALGVAGTILVVGPDLAANASSPLWAKLALLGASMSYGLAAVFAKRFRGTAPPVIAAGQLVMSSLFTLPVALALPGFGALLTASTGVWVAIAAIALVSTALGYILFFRLLASAGAINASLVTLLVPVSAILLGALFLGERIAAWEVVGMAVIALGFSVIDGRMFARLRRSSSAA